MKRWVLAWIGLWAGILTVFCCWFIAKADPAVGNSGVARLPAQYAILANSGTTTLSSARIFMGVANLNSAAQINIVTCYDSASGATGPVIFQGAVGPNPPIFPNDGVALTNGLVCQNVLALLGAGVAVYYR